MSFNSFRREIDSCVSSIIVLSVISRTSVEGERPLSLNASRTSTARRGLCNWRIETFTHTRNGTFVG